jgi:stage IV sporulation protein FB
MTPRFQLAGFPVQVHPLFFLTTLALGSPLFREPMRLVVWFCVVFSSVLAHELGHAWMYRRWGFHASIQLHGLGGTTTGEGGGRLTHRQKLWVSLAGPGTNLLLGGLILGLRALTPVGQLGGLVAFALWALITVNFGLMLLNLLPIHPLDGGQAMGAVIRQRGGHRWEWLVHFISVVTAACVLVFAVLRKDLWLAMFGLILGLMNALPLWRTRVERRYMLQLRSAATSKRPVPAKDEKSASVTRLLEELNLSSHAPPPPPAAEPRPKPTVPPSPARAPVTEPPEVPQDPQFLGEWLLDNGLAELAIRPLRAAFATEPSAQTAHSLATALLNTGRYEDVTRLLTGAGAAHLGAETLQLITSRAEAADQSALATRARELHARRAPPRALSSAPPHDTEKPD